MDCAALSCNGGFTLDTLTDSFHKSFHVDRRASRWACSASTFGKAGQATVKQVEKPGRERDKWLSQLTGYIRQGKVDEAEELMRKMQEVGLTPDLLSYNSMITVTGKAGRFRSAQGWFSRLEAEKGLRPDAVTYRSMIGACGRAGDLEEALRLYYKMKACGFRPSNQNFNTLITLLRKADRSNNWEEQVLSLLVDMREMGCCPDSFTVDVVVKFYERWVVLEKLPDAISLLEAAGWTPTRRCHSIVLKAYIKCGLVDQALDVFHMLCGFGSHNTDDQVKVLESSGEGALYYKQGDDKFTLPMRDVHNQVLNQSSIAVSASSSKHNTVVHNTQDHTGNGNAAMAMYRLDESMCHSLICLCRTSDRYTEAMQVYSEMRRSGTKPSWFTACTVIDVCAHLNEASAVENGEALFEEMRSSALGRESTDVGAYTVTINMFLKAGLVQKAAEVSSLVAEHTGLVPDPALFLAMLRAYSRSGMPAKAVQVYKKMLEVRLTWTASMFNGVIHCCGRALPLEEIIKVFLAMVYAKVPLSSVTCNLMMDIFAKAGLLDKAENVFRLAKEQRVIDTVSYNTMIDAYGKYKEFNKMECAMLDMQNSGLKDHLQAYNSMLDAYGKSGQLNRMENILERMKRADCPPDLSTYNTLINVYGREGLIADLQQVRKDMEEANMKPDNYTFNTLIFAYGNAEMPNEAMKAFKEMQDLRLVPDEVTYNCLIAAFEKSGNHLEAARWSLWMTQLGMK